MTTTASANVSISSLRVEKPGKTRFEPVLGGERRRPATREQPQPSPQAQHQRPSSRVPQDEAATASLTMAPEVVAELAVLPPASTPGTRIIEGVASRRERRRSVTATGATPDLETGALPESGRSAASLVNIVPSSATGRVTMAHFLRDTGTGIPMSSSVRRGGGPSSLPPVTRTISRPASTTMTVVPQVRVVDGELVVEERTMAEDSVAASQTTTLEVVNETGKHLTSHAFVKTIGPNRWSREETDRFYEALSMCGTDFALISLFFARRSREQIKGKYKVEERSHPGRVALALKRRRPLDVAWLEAAQRERHALTGTSVTAHAAITTLPGEERKPGRPRRENASMDSLLVSSPNRSTRTGGAESVSASPSKAGSGIAPSPIRASPVRTSSPVPRSAPSSPIIASPVRKSPRLWK